MLTRADASAGVSYVGRALRAVAAEGLPLLLADANPDRASEAADWALSVAGGVRYVRVPDACARRVAAAADARDAARIAATPPGTSQTAHPQRIAPHAAEHARPRPSHPQASRCGGARGARVSKICGVGKRALIGHGHFRPRWHRVTLRIFSI
jgi:hypothetical protein